MTPIQAYLEEKKTFGFMSHYIVSPFYTDRFSYVILFAVSPKIWEVMLKPEIERLLRVAFSTIHSGVVRIHHRYGRN